MGREACKPQWNASNPSKCCVFCTGKSWLCNPPDSWVEGGKGSFPCVLYLCRSADQALVPPYSGPPLDMKQDVQDLNVMVMPALHNQRTTPSLLHSLGVCASTLPLPVSRSSSRIHTPRDAASDNETRMNEEPSTARPCFIVCFTSDYDISLCPLSGGRIANKKQRWAQTCAFWQIGRCWFNLRP